MLVFKGFEVTGPDECIDHEPNSPGQIWWHLIVAVYQFVAFSQGLFALWVGLVNQPTGGSQYTPILRGVNAPREVVLTLSLGNSGIVEIAPTRKA